MGIKRCKNIGCKKMCKNDKSFTNIKFIRVREIVTSKLYT